MCVFKSSDPTETKACECMPRGSQEGTYIKPAAVFAFVVINLCTSESAPCVTSGIRKSKTKILAPDCNYSLSASRLSDLEA